MIRDGHHEAHDTQVGGRCCEVSGNDVHRGRRRSARKSAAAEADVDFYPDDDHSSMSCGTSSSGYNNASSSQRGAGDEPVLTERDKKEFMSLANENISMDFILEMKEAFQLFDKVNLVTP